MTETELNEFEFSAELKKYQFRDWRFEPLFISDRRPGLTGGEVAQGMACRSFGVRICYTVPDNRFPDSGRQITLHVNRFFDPSHAVNSQQGWPLWVRAWLWGHVRWVLDHEAREQFFYDGELPYDPHAATGGTLAVPKPSAPGTASRAPQPTPSHAHLKRFRKAFFRQSGRG